MLADRWAPQAADGSLPAALVRTPYGRRGPLGGLFGRALAERGFQVSVQSTRGTFGSGGVFDPMRCEREDGLATLDCVREQPWFGGSIVLAGPSYLGYVQWAMAGQFPRDVKAMIPLVTESALTLEFLRADGLSLETPFGWGVMVAGQERRGALLCQLALNGKVQRGPAHCAARPGGRGGHRPPVGLHPGRPRLWRECSALGRARPPGPGGGGHRPGQLDRRLV